LCLSGCDPPAPPPPPPPPRGGGPPQAAGSLRRETTANLDRSLGSTEVMIKRSELVP
jgi:hypothetical protein